MGLFDYFFKQRSATSPEGFNLQLRDKLVKYVLNVLTEPGGRIHIEDAISAAATIVAERCIDAAGDYPLRNHTFPPGARIFSTKANQLICANVSEGTIKDVPGNTIVGILRNRLDDKMYADADFPLLKVVFEKFAASIGKSEEWGRVPLSLPESHRPFIPPLRIGYETRKRVDRILEPISTDKLRCLQVATEGLAEILRIGADAFNRSLALTLAIETINGMSKTAPFTGSHGKFDQKLPKK